MDKSTELLIRLGRFVRAISVPVVWAYGQWAVFAAVLDRVPFHQAMAWGALSSAAIGAALFVALKIIDRYIEARDGTREAHAIAHRFDDLRSAGFRTLTLAQATRVWVGDSLTDDLAAYPMTIVKLRQLKFAIKQGVLPCETWSSDKSDEFPNEKQECRTEAYAEFIRRRAWRYLHDEPSWSDPAPRKAAGALSTAGRNKNWVTNWR